MIHSSAQLFGRIKAPAFSLVGMDRPEHMQRWAGFEVNEEKCFSGESLSPRAFTKYFQISAIAEINCPILAGGGGGKEGGGDKEVKRNKLKHMLNPIAMC